MRNIDNKYYFIIILLIISCIISWKSYLKEYNRQDINNVHVFPKEIGEWQSRELDITDEEYDILETRNAFAREYSNNKGTKVVLFIVYSKDNRKVSHPPEICYTGGGATIIKKDSIPLKITINESIIANKLLMEYHNSYNLSLYWFKVGNLFTPNYWKQQMLFAVKTLTGQSAGSALIRVSMSIESKNSENAINEINSFLQTIHPFLLKYLP